MSHVVKHLVNMPLSCDQWQSEKLSIEIGGDNRGFLSVLILNLNHLRLPSVAETKFGPNRGPLAGDLCDLKVD